MNVSFLTAALSAFLWAPNTFAASLSLVYLSCPQFLSISLHPHEHYFFVRTSLCVWEAHMKLSHLQLTAFSDIFYPSQVPSLPFLHSGFHFFSWPPLVLSLTCPKKRQTLHTSLTILPQGCGHVCHGAAGGGGGGEEGERNSRRSFYLFLYSEIFFSTFPLYRQL